MYDMCIKNALPTFSLRASMNKEKNPSKNVAAICIGDWCIT